MSIIVEQAKENLEVQVPRCTNPSSSEMRDKIGHNA
jgi:hypothetical protein